MRVRSTRVDMALEHQQIQHDKLRQGSRFPRIPHQVVTLNRTKLCLRVRTSLSIARIWLHRLLDPCVICLDPFRTLHQPLVSIQQTLLPPVQTRGAQCPLPAAVGFHLVATPIVSRWLPLWLLRTHKVDLRSQRDHDITFQRLFRRPNPTSPMNQAIAPALKGFRYGKRQRRLTLLR